MEFMYADEEYYEEYYKEYYEDLCVRNLYEEFARLAETRLAQNTLYYLDIA